MLYRLSIYDQGKLKKIEQVKNLRLAKMFAVDYIRELKKKKPKKKGFDYKYSITKDYKSHIVCKTFGFEAGVEIHIKSGNQWIELKDYFKLTA